MPTRGRYGWGPTWPDIDSYPRGIGSIGGSWSIVTYDGKLRLKGEGGYVSGTQWRWNYPPTFASEAWRWGVFGIRLVSSDVQDSIFGDDGNLISFAVKRVTATTFKVMMGKAVTGWTEQAVSISTFTQNTDLIFLYQVHSPSKLVKIWINGNPEIEYTPQGQGTGAMIPALVGAFTELPLPSGDVIYYWQFAGRESDAESGRPNTSPDYSIHDPSADTAEDDGLPNGGAGGADDHDWWDDHGNPDEDATYLLFDEAAERKHVSEFSAGAALTGNLAALSVTGYRRARAAAGDKTANSWMRYKDDGGTAKEFAHANLISDTYRTDGEHCGDPPAGTWSAYVNDSDVFNGSGSSKKLQLGQRTPAANDTNIRMTSEGFEVCALGDDPPGPDEGHQYYPEANIPSNPLLKVVASGMTVGGKIE